jgi:hypothetical protein
VLSCKEVTERASEYLDHDLSRWEWLKVGLHIAMYKHCARYLQQLDSTMKIVRSLPAKASSRS